MFILCSLYAPIHQNRFQVGVNLLGNKYNSDFYSDSDVRQSGAFPHLQGTPEGTDIQ